MSDVTATGESGDLSLQELESTAENAPEPILSTEENEGEMVRTAGELEAVYDIPVQVSAVLGKSRMQVSNLMKLGRGAVVELNRGVGEDIDIHANTRLVATGEVIVIEDRLGVNITEIVKCPSSYKLEQSTA